MRKIMIALIVCILSFTFFIPESHAFVGQVLKISTKTAIKLAQLGKTKGSKYVGEELMKLAEKVPAAQRLRFIEHSYAEILVRQGRLTAAQADDIVRNLSGTPGFRSALSKMSGISDAKASGHGFEVLTANALKKSGYDIVAIGQRFDDGIKNAMTDIDLIAKKGRTTYIFELKNYRPQSIDHNALINFRGDMQSLNAYARQNSNVRSIFAISSRPVDKGTEALLQAAAKSQNVQLFYGDSNSIPMMLEMMK